MTLIIHPDADIHPMASVEDSVRGSLIQIGARTTIDAFARIKPAGGLGDMVIGEDCYFNPGVVLYSGNGLTIGNDVLVGANVVIAPVAHEFMDRHTTIRPQRFRVAERSGITIGNDVMISAGSIIIDGAVIPDGVVLGAMTLLRDEVLEPYGVYVGTPPRKVNERR